jgi:glycosyltransferase involved in cell wall biosynthesis
MIKELTQSQRQRIIKDKSLYISSDTLPPDPLVSVLMWTYNDSPYIRKAIASVLAQETDFPYELVISDDCSTDGTTEIIKEYCEKYPNKIRLVLSKENLFESGVITERLLEQGRGLFIALHHGDDYWCDTTKLARQVKLMESAPIPALCFCGVTIKVENTGEQYPAYVERPEKGWQIKMPARETTIVDMASGNFIHTPGVMLRKFDFSCLSHYSRFAIGDWPLYMVAAQRGNIIFDPQVMAVYRVHGQGSWSMRRQEDKSWEWCRLNCDMLDSLQWQQNVVSVLRRNVLKTLRSQCALRTETEIQKLLSYVGSAGAGDSDIVETLLADLREARLLNQRLNNEIAELRKAMPFRLAFKWCSFKRSWRNKMKSESANNDSANVLR